ncbi:MAG TPA: S8 family serine peptidase, partial [Saprospiraceae bacterium]|nr:S8 family serine peptidase [Saprospiraceae bacterium]
MKYLFSILILFISFYAIGQQETTISQRLQKAIAQDADRYQNISILLSDRFDMVKLDNELNARRASLQERVMIVKKSLQEKANAIQPAFIAYLKTLPGVDATSIKVLWITNMLFCRIKGSEIRELAKRTDIEFMDINAELKLSAEKDQLNLPLFFKPDGAEPGLKAVNADKLWALGYSGYGRKAYVADTGIDPTHPAFANKARSLYVPQAQTWYDFKGGITPYNCGVHGSHVLGTILGLDRLKSDTVGVAFNAQWMGGAILCGVGTQDNLEGLQWAIDPDNDPTTIDDMPDIINNSWYDPDITDDCSSGYIDVEAALEAAGIASIFSAGNAGPDVQTITPPHNINISLVNSFTVAAVNGNNPFYPIADFSSRGPSKCGGTGSLLIKPEVAAPGLNVRSCSYNQDYELLSGTSMACPHTCGTILLLKEAFPYLSGYDLKMALYNSCTDLGDPGEDNTFGMGLINAWAAYNYLVLNGNVPVDPTVNRDLILIDVETKPYQCEKTLEAKAFIENAGKDTITEFQLNYTITNSQGLVLNYQQEWTGVLAHGQRVELEINPVLVSIGKSTILYEIVKVNNDIDERPLNNRVKKEPVIIDSPYQSASILAGSNVSTCEGTKVLLQSSFDQNGTVDWYDENGNKLGSGNPFLV